MGLVIQCILVLRCIEVKLAGEGSAYYMKGMKRATECPKCGGRMDRGWIMDGTHGGVNQSRWIEGVPEKSFWTGTKIDKTKEMIAITTYRCSACGFLESYATRE